MTFRQTISAAIASVLLLPGCGRGVQYPDDVRTALKELDEVIAQKEMIEAQKEDRITQIKGKLADASDDRL